MLIQLHAVGLMICTLHESSLTSIWGWVGAWGDDLIGKLCCISGTLRGMYRGV